MASNPGKETKPSDTTSPRVFIEEDSSESHSESPWDLDPEISQLTKDADALLNSILRGEDSPSEKPAKVSRSQVPSEGKKTEASAQHVEEEGDADDDDMSDEMNRLALASDEIRELHEDQYIKKHRPTPTSSSSNSDNRQLKKELSVSFSLASSQQDKDPPINSSLRREVPSQRNPKQLRHSHSSTVSTMERYDNNLLHRAVADAGRWAYGILLSEVWALDSSATYLFRPESSWWIDPVYHRECDHNCQICRLTNADRHDYVAPQHLSPGEGLPGVLWAEASTSHWSQSWRENLASRLLGTSDPDDLRGGEISLNALNHHRVIWRDVKQLNDDPDQPWNPRLKLLASLGLGWAAAVPFHLHGHQGIVVYMAREGVDMSRLQSSTNEDYLIAASDLIAAAYALRTPRKQVVVERRGELRHAMRRVRERIMEARRMGISLADIVKQEEAKSQRQEEWNVEQSESVVKAFTMRVKQTVVTTLIKSKGAGVGNPPSFSWKQSFLTFVGVFVTLLMITRLNVGVEDDLGEEFGFVLGPMGAFMTLLYGLTAAPASQPRNAILGHSLSMTVALSLTYAPMRVWLRQSLSAALSIAAMAKLGSTHPPAGASAVVYASGSLGWTNMIFMLVANVIAIVTATVVNNMSNKRQYPSNWGLSWLEPVVVMVWKGAEGLLGGFCSCIDAIEARVGGNKKDDPTEGFSDDPLDP